MKKKFLSFSLVMVMLISLFPYVPVQVEAYTVPDAARDTPAEAQVITTTNSYSGTTNTRHWGIVWSDEFTGNSLDKTKWDYQPGNGSEYMGFPGWGNEELQYYTQGENISFRNGQLVMTAKPERRGSNNYTSAKLRTINSGWVGDGRNAPGDYIQNQLFTTKYGRIEARIALPLGTGLWPAFWMMPANDVYGGWAACGEIDIMEARGRREVADHIGGAIHFGGPWPANIWLSADYPAPGNRNDWTIADFHTYAVEWSEGEIIWFCDGVPFQRRTANNWSTTAAPNNNNAPFDQEFYIILNLAVGGMFDNHAIDSATWETPAEMIVDYVRVYHQITEGPSITPTPTPTPAPSNIALNKPASASSFQDNNDGTYPSVNGNDGNNTSRWAADSTGTQACNEWWMVDLGQVYNLSGFMINWEEAAADRFTIKASLTNPGTTPDPNANIWTTIHSKDSGTQGAGVISSNFSNATGRWVMIHCTRRAFSWENNFYGPSFYEFELYGNLVTGDVVYGDVNGDGVINAADVTLLRRYLAATNKTAFQTANPSFNPDNADVNGNSEINEDDVTLLREYLAASNPNIVRFGK